VSESVWKCAHKGRTSTVYTFPLLIDCVCTSSVYHRHTASSYCLTYCRCPCRGAAEDAHHAGRD
jgi:hypothetical protein